MGKAKKALFALSLALAGCTPALRLELVDVEAREKLNEIIAECCPQTKGVSNVGEAN